MCNRTAWRSEGLKPSEEADRRILIRRVTLDLHGARSRARAERKRSSATARRRTHTKKSSTACSILPAYAEHEAVGWLDAVRYADTAGYHSDGDRPAWPYRDYVLKAFRENKPFDQFTREQLGGDLHAQRHYRAENRIGLQPHGPHVGGKGVLQAQGIFLPKYGADRVRALGGQLARQHARLRGMPRSQIRSGTHHKRFLCIEGLSSPTSKKRDSVADVGPDAFSPKMPVYQTGEKERIDNLIRQIAAAKTELDAKADSHAEQRRQWERETLDHAKLGETAWKFQMPAAASAQIAKLTIDVNGPTAAEIAASSALRGGSPGGPGMVVVGGPNLDNETYAVTLKPGPGVWASVGIEVDSDLSLLGANVSRGSDRFIVTEVDAQYSADGRQAPEGHAVCAGIFRPLRPLPVIRHWLRLTEIRSTGWGFFGGAGKLLP